MAREDQGVASPVVNVNVAIVANVNREGRIIDDNAGRVGHKAGALFRRDMAGFQESVGGQDDAQVKRVFHGWIAPVMLAAHSRFSLATSLRTAPMPRSPMSR